MNFFQKILIVVPTILFCSVLRMSAQNEFEGVVKFDKTVHDFGDILINDGAQKCVFTLTNISDKPIVIHRAISSCGCTEPKWTKNPIKPGEQATINVTFNNDQGPYPFDKSITTYVSDVSKPIILRIRGVAYEKKKSLGELFSDKFGLFGMRSSTLNLGVIDQGLTRIESVEVANLSSKEIKVDFVDMTPGLSLSLEANPIPPKSKTKLSFSVNTLLTKEKIWGKNIFEAAVSVNGQRQNGRIKVETLIKDNFSNYTAEQKKSGALPQFNNSSLSFGTCKEGKIQKLVFSCKNIGKEPLIIYKVDSSEPGCTFKYPEKILSGESGDVEITIDTKGVDGEILHIITIITNAPIRPMVNIFVTGNVE